jgi:hypothetical protein
MSLRVDPQLLGTKFYRMAIYFEGKLLGEYERSQAADIDRKTEEIQCALPKLLEISQTHGEFRVRWDGKVSTRERHRGLADPEGSVGVNHHGNNGRNVVQPSFKSSINGVALA